jgi:hypothetical protein
MGGTTQPTHEVFISYANADKRWADAACNVLEGRGIRCWIAPRDIRPGTEWGASIITGIDGCKIMVLIFSAAANASPQVRREVERAISKGVTVVPCRVEDVRPVGAMEYALGNTHWLDAFTPPVERQMNHLAQSVQALLGPDGGAAEPPIARKPAKFQYPELAPAPVPPDAEYALGLLAKAKRLVKAPAIAMLVIGILLLAIFLFRTVALSVILLVYGAHLNWLPEAFVPLLFFDDVAGVLIFAGVSMMQLRRYWLCMLSSILVVLPLVTIPIGIWSLVALRRPGMRSAFRLNEQEESIADLDRV